MTAAAAPDAAVAPAEGGAAGTAAAVPDELADLIAALPYEVLLKCFLLLGDHARRLLCHCLKADIDADQRPVVLGPPRLPAVALLREPVGHCRRGWARSDRTYRTTLLLSVATRTGRGRRPATTQVWSKGISSQVTLGWSHRGKFAEGQAGPERAREVWKEVARFLQSAASSSEIPVVRSTESLNMRWCLQLRFGDPPEEHLYTELSEGLLQILRGLETVPESFF